MGMRFRLVAATAAILLLAMVVVLLYLDLPARPDTLARWTERNGMALAAPDALPPRLRARWTPDGRGLILPPRAGMPGERLYFVPISKLGKPRADAVRAAIFPGGTAYLAPMGVGAAPRRIRARDVGRLYLRIALREGAARCGPRRTPCTLALVQDIYALLEHPERSGRSGHPMAQARGAVPPRALRITLAPDMLAFVTAGGEDWRSICGFDALRARVPGFAAEGCTRLLAMRYGARRNFMAAPQELIPLRSDALADYLDEAVRQGFRRDGLLLNGALVADVAEDTVPRDSGAGDARNDRLILPAPLPAASGQAGAGPSAGTRLDMAPFARVWVDPARRIALFFTSDRDGGGEGNRVRAHFVDRAGVVDMRALLSVEARRRAGPAERAADARARAMLALTGLSDVPMRVLPARDGYLFEARYGALYFLSHGRHDGDTLRLGHGVDMALFDRIGRDAGLSAAWRVLPQPVVAPGDPGMTIAFGRVPRPFGAYIADAAPRLFPVGRESLWQLSDLAPPLSPLDGATIATIRARLSADTPLFPVARMPAAH